MRYLTQAMLTVAFGAAAFAAMPVPRQSQEFKFVEPGGKTSMLSSYKGKVVVVQFLYTTCPHCQALSRVLTKMSPELGPGVQFIGVAFEEDNPQKEAAAASTYMVQQGVKFPIAYATRDEVMSYLGISVMDRFVVPQIAIIDKKGIVRAQSAPMGTESLQREETLKPLIEGLLKEGGSAPPHTNAAPAAKTPEKLPAPSAKKTT
jgi:thiol-disulfide isomerase/thioredoxin